MAEMGVSVVLAVKNEENNLKRCLDSVQWADEIIIVDNDSTDNTIKIAKRYTDRIYPFKDKAFIPKIQQFGIEKATKEWILVLDADIVVPKATKDEILERIHDEKYNAYYLDHVSYFLGKPTKSRCWVFSNVKLFRKGYGFYMAERPHCALRVKGKCGKIKNPLLHNVYPTISSFLTTMDLYTSQDAPLFYQKKKAGFLNKRIERVNMYNLIIEPLLLSLYYFFKGRGFKDGYRGVILSVLYFQYLFVERAKLFEIEIKNKK